MEQGKPGVVVKNTLEVGDHMPSLSDWRRQMSEPVKIFTSQSADEFEEVAEVEAEAPEEPPLPFSINSMAPPSTSSTHPGTGQMSPLPGAMQPGALAPAQCFEAQNQQPMMPRQGVREPGRRDIRNGQAINQLKNNDITSKEPPWNDVTTVMMRNLPNKYRQQMLLDELADASFRAQTDFDFFYLPMDHSNAANLGYCFINFTEPALANAFAAAFQGKKMRRFNSHKTVVVMPASIQGYERNYKYYSSTRVAQAEDPAYRPLFLKNFVDLEVPQDRKGAGKGKGFEKGGKGKKGSKDKGGSKGMPDGKGVEAFSRLAFMGLDDPNSTQGDWVPAEQMPWSQPMMQPSFPGPTPGGRSGPTVTCQNCGNVCSAEHRFCSACGAPVQKPSGASNNSGPPMPAGPPRVGPSAGPPVMNGMPMACGPVWGCGGCGGCCPCGPCGSNAFSAMNMRADAPTFMPNTQEEPESQSRQMQSGSNQLADPVTNELDVMRGRLMLIAALKDIEQRDSEQSTRGKDAWLA